MSRKRVIRLFSAALFAFAGVFVPLITNNGQASAVTYYTHNFNYGSWTYISGWYHPASSYGNAPTTSDKWYDNRYTPSGDIGLLNFPDGWYTGVGTFTVADVEFKVFMNCELHDWSGKSYCNPYGGNYIYTDQQTVVSTSPNNPLSNYYADIAVDFSNLPFYEGLVLHNVDLSMFWNGVSSSVDGPDAPSSNISANSVDFGTHKTADCSSLAQAITITGSAPGNTINIRFRSDEYALTLGPSGTADFEFTWPSELCEVGEFYEELEIWENDGTYDGEILVVAVSLKLIEPSPLPPATGAVSSDGSNATAEIAILVSFSAMAGIILLLIWLRYRKI
jgi:hypothetical protein